MRFPWSFLAASVLVTALGAATSAARRQRVVASPGVRAVPGAPAALVATSEAPELRNTSWLNADHALRLAELRGRVVLLNFWVFTCYNCTNTVPSLVEFDRRYRDTGLTLIGIHTPEFPPYSGAREARHCLSQRPGQRSAHLGYLWDPLLAELRADRQTGTDPLRRLRRVPSP